MIALLNPRRPYSRLRPPSVRFRGPAIERDPDSPGPNHPPLGRRCLRRPGVLRLHDTVQEDGARTAPMAHPAGIPSIRAAWEESWASATLMAACLVSRLVALPGDAVTRREHAAMLA